MGPVLGRLFSHIKMRAFAFVLLAVAAVKADSDPYTIGQVASGLTHGGVVTGVDYSNGVVSGVGAIGNRAYAGHVGYAGVGHLGYANHVVAAPSAYGYSTPAFRAYSTPADGYAGHYYGKREAEAEPEADAYTIGQVAAGLPVANAYATGHAHNVGVVTGTTYAHAAPAVAAYAAPAVASYAAPAVAGYTGVVASPAVHAYSTLGHRYAGHYYGKREAEAEPEADAYTIGQVAAGLPVARAYATGYPHNVVTGTTYAHAAPAYSTRYNYAAPTYTTGYAGHLGYAGLGYAARGYTGAFYG